jgi:hypothetical protein
MTKKTILLYDDEPSKERRWVDRLKGIRAVSTEFDVIALTTSQFKDEVSVLEERRKEARRRKPGTVSGGALIDDAAILFVDFDIVNAFSEATLTGESMAYLARCYSTVGFIVVVNQFGDKGFDLRLRTHPESFADLNIGGSDLGNAGLWKEPWKGFRPWSWPLIPNALDAGRIRSNEAANSLDKPIIEVLEFPSELVGTLPTHAIEFLTDGGNLSKLTLRKVALGRSGLRGRDKATNDESLGRIAAARVNAWLERVVLPLQDILVDAPHLAARLPSLLTGDETRVTSWNKTASLGPAGKLGLRSKSLLPHRFVSRHWISREAWYWGLILRDARVAEFGSPWELKATTWVFCEDISRFVDKEAATEFISDIPSPYARRFVVNRRALSASSLLGKGSVIQYQSGSRLLG